MKIHQSSSLIKVRKWWPAVIFFILNAILHNSHVIYCKLKREKRNMPFKEFKVSVAEDIIANNSFVKSKRRSKVY